MAGLTNIFKSITDSDFLYLYLDAIKKNQAFAVQNTNEADEVLQTINSLLVKENSRKRGLELLKVFLTQCSQDTFEQKANFWCIQTFKACKGLSTKKEISLVYNIIGNLAERCQQSTDLSKLFASTYLGKVYECFHLLPFSKQKYALKTIRQCLELYPGPSKQFQNLIEKVLCNHGEARNGRLIHTVGVCHLLLQQVRRDGSQSANLKIQWQQHQSKLITQLSEVLTNFYDSISPTSIPTISFNSIGPLNDFGKLYISFHSTINYLITALRSPFPTSKIVSSYKLLTLIQKALSVAVPQLSESVLSDNLALMTVVPKIHIDALDLLQCLILTLGCHLKVHASFIMNMLADTLTWTTFHVCEKLKKSFSSLRIKAYNVIGLWCEMMQSGSCCEILSEGFLEVMLTDLFSTKPELSLKVLNGQPKNLSKKAKRLLSKTQNENSSITQTNSNKIVSRKRSYVCNQSVGTCVAAHRFLQRLLISCSTFMTTRVLKLIYAKLLNISVLLPELLMCRTNLYYSSKCRLEIYSTLNVMLLSRHKLVLSPVGMIVKILKKASVNDRKWIVRSHCSEILRHLESVIRPEKVGLSFSFPEGSNQLYRDAIILNNFDQDHTASSFDFYQDPDSTAVSSGIVLGNINEKTCLETEESTERANVNENNYLQTKKSTETNNTVIESIDIESTENSKSIHIKSLNVEKNEQTASPTKAFGEPLAKVPKDATSLSPINITALNSEYDDNLVREIQLSFVDELA